ncbi:uncharacterized protein LOC130897033 isoform X1 [Diorhabda carinulata]|uniref:uncharacterized protein LOC130897033 isoform X1 n=1 Tax=Diorhabda carinulata TaxID=1163345 RepID=UPI0025A2650F|nr:uncharacterized protein LOC130897033 isoform X1 [Diorhabda carinulata]XP_057661504.1 uncharacterized protein LOC130897033 isoform X1 [Diorhabda carinulata]XP_057661505.1 uncharacterized protein LOC130897033 isoform X1 [Diorhabda carinulata]
MDEVTSIFIILFILMVIIIIIIEVCKANRQSTYQHTYSIPVRQQPAKFVPQYRVYTPFNTMYARNQNTTVHHVHHVVDDSDQMSAIDYTLSVPDDTDDTVACDTGTGTGIAGTVADMFMSSHNNESSAFDYSTNDDGGTYDYNGGDSNEDYSSGIASGVVASLPSAVENMFSSTNNEESYAYDSGNNTYDGGNNETTYDECIEDTTTYDDGDGEVIED